MTNNSLGVDQMEAGLATITPLGRVAQPIDIARVVCFLASPDSYWVNGETIGISGGAPT
jgi:tetrahydroxynaphthalene reductase